MSSEDQNFSRILEAARTHAANVQTDIANAKDRIEHIRLTALAQEARNLLTELESYRARGVAIPESESKSESDAAAAATFNETQEVLDLPDFKSPYNPRA